MNESISTKLDGWINVAKNPARLSWSDRAEIAAYFIRPGDIVCDLGAGAQQLRTFLPNNVRYVPVDCVKAHDDTWVADFNSDFTLPNIEFNVFTALGLLYHITNVDNFLDFLSRKYEGKYIIFTHDFRDYSKTEGRHAKLGSILEDYNKGVEFFSQYIRELTPVTKLRFRIMFTGVLGQGKPYSIKEKGRLSRLICAHATITDVIKAKIANPTIKPKFIRKIIHNNI